MSLSCNIRNPPLGRASRERCGGSRYAWPAANRRGTRKGSFRDLRTGIRTSLTPWRLILRAKRCRFPVGRALVRFGGNLQMLSICGCLIRRPKQNNLTWWLSGELMTLSIRANVLEKGGGFTAIVYFALPLCAKGKSKWQAERVFMTTP